MKWTITFFVFTKKMQILNIFYRIARQLNYKQRTLTSAITAKLEIPGFSYEAFEQGGRCTYQLMTHTVPQKRVCN